MISQLIGSFILLILFIFFKIYLRPYLRIKSIINIDSKRFYNQFIPFDQYLNLYERSYQKFDISLQWMINIIQKYPDVRVIVTNFYHVIIIIITDPKLAKTFLQNQKQFKRVEVFLQKKRFNKGLLFLEGNQVIFTRQIMGKMFNFENIKKNYQLILNITNLGINKLILSKKFLIIDCQDKKIPLKLLSFFQQITGQVISKSFFSNDVQDLKMNEKSFEKEIVSLFERNIKAKSSFKYFIKEIIFGIEFADKYQFQNEKELVKDINNYDEYVQSIIRKRINQRLIEKNKIPDQLDYFLDEYDQINQEEKKEFIDYIQQNFQTLVFAGIDTSSHVACMAIYNLANNLDIKNLLIQKIQKTVQKLETNEEIEKIMEIDYLTNVINETLRLHTPAAGILPRIAIKDLYIDDLFVKKDEVIDLGIQALNMNPLIFKNPTKFDPDRWINLKLNSYEFLPFSAGQRNCIGQHLAIIQIKIILACFLMKLDFSPIQNKKLRMYYTGVQGPSDDQLVEVSVKKQN